MSHDVVNGALTAILNINGPEMIVLVILAMIFIGPQRLPEVSRTVGQALGTLRRYRESLQAEMEAAAKESGLDEIRDTVQGEYEKARRGVSESTAAIATGFEGAATTLTAGPSLDPRPAKKPIKPKTQSMAAATPTPAGELTEGDLEGRLELTEGVDLMPERALQATPATATAEDAGYADVGSETAVEPDPVDFPVEPPDLGAGDASAGASGVAETGVVDASAGAPTAGSDGSKGD